MNFIQSSLKPRFSSVTFLLISTVLPVILAGQNGPAYPSYAARTSAAPDQNSRAEQAAEKLVSLSAEKIILLLDREPGLLLEVKKMLVRKAYDQGRVLDPQDLTDDALYKLIGKDENVRVLITREIEDRQYIRAKPTRRELQALAANHGATGLAGLPQGKPEEGKSQEEAFWTQYAQTLQNAPQSSAPASGSQPSPAQPAPQPSQPQVSPFSSPWNLDRAQMQYPAGDSEDMPLGGLSIGGGGAGGMQGVSPDQLSALMAARMTDSSAGGMGVGGDDASSRLGLGLSPNGMGSADQLSNPFLNPSMLGSSLAGGSNSDYSQMGLQQYPQQTSLQMMRPRSTGSSVSDMGLDRPALMRRPNPYADVPSLYDLYSQYSRRAPVLTRFGSEIFRNGIENFGILPMDMPMGPDYVLGPGDSLTINLWGGISQRLIRVVDRSGVIALPESGTLQVAGRTLGDVQRMVQNALRAQYRDEQADVAISRLHSIRVFVVGDVEHPGAYDVGSLSTPLNALLEAGGPTSKGSLRIVRHLRGNQLIQEVDVYDLLLHGVRAGVQRLETGDTVLVPPLGPEVTITGMVRRPAIYELDGEKSLSEVLELAGGVLPSGTLRHIDVERLDAHESRTMLALDIPENNNKDAVTKALDDFKIQDGDKVKISPIVSYADKAVYLDGHVYKPGKYAYTDGMKITDLVKSYKELLPEPYKAHAEVIRLEAPDFTPQVIAFNLEDALAGKDQDLALKPLDTVRIFGRYDFEDAPVITVTGAVRDPGDHVTNGVTYLRDAVYLAGNATPDAELDDVQVFRTTADGKLDVLSANFKKALEGDYTENILLEPKDRVFIHKNLAKTDPPVVTIEGEIARPGKYPLGQNMSVADLVRLSGGLKRGAYTQEADLTRYELEGGSKIVSDHVSVPLAAALAGQPDADVRLRDGDVLTVRQVTGWNDLGATIKVDGEVMYPGTYGIQEGERLSSIIQRAGGFRKDAYPYGAVLERIAVRQLQEQDRADLIRRVKGEEASVSLTAGGAQEDARQATLLQYQSTLANLETAAPAGRMVVHISSNVQRWANTPADVQVRAGDSLFVPKRPNIVIVNGTVYNPTAITYKPGKNAGWYLRQAGGPTELANKKAIFVIRADGAVVGGPAGLFTGGAEAAVMQPGDMVVVPEKTFNVSHTFQNAVQVSQILTAVALAVEAARTF
jgi:protein involved in polysaccharide export with SLBB domain